MFVVRWLYCGLCWMPTARGTAAWLVFVASGLDGQLLLVPLWNQQLHSLHAAIKCTVLLAGNWLKRGWLRQGSTCDYGLHYHHHHHLGYTYMTFWTRSWPWVAPGTESATGTHTAELVIFQWPVPNKVWQCEKDILPVCHYLHGQSRQQVRRAYRGDAHTGVSHSTRFEPTVSRATSAKAPLTPPLPCWLVKLGNSVLNSS